MCLTEPQCGTDLGLLRTKAEPQADGSYQLTGNKIFISAGEHDLAENIIHLVLARLPDAPAGSKGISLFVVPKFNVKADGSLGERNAICCGGLEHKMGIHGNATAQIDPRRRRRHAGRPAEQGPAGDVRDDERGAPRRRHAVARPDRGRLPERRWPTPRSGCRCARCPAPKAPGQAGRSDHRPPRRAQDAADRARLRRRRPRAGDVHARCCSTRSCASRRRGRAQGLRRPGRAADADRQGLLHRQRAGSRPRTACRSSAATATSANRAWSSSCATRAST